MVIQGVALHVDSFLLSHLGNPHLKLSETKISVLLGHRRAVYWPADNPRTASPAGAHPRLRHFHLGGPREGVLGFPDPEGPVPGHHQLLDGLKHTPGGSP